MACRALRTNQRIVNLTSRQLNLDLNGGLSGSHSAKVAAAIEKLSAATGTESRGAIFTRVEVVEFILDLAGYTEDKLLARKRLLEPSFGGGDFLLPAVSRLLRAWRAGKNTGSALDDLGEAIRAVELHQATFESTRTAVIALLIQEGLTKATAVALADCWLITWRFPVDTLAAASSTYVVGNPPYVRQEMIPATLLNEYRGRYPTMYDRADLYTFPSSKGR
jgi:hypothetical protein